MNGRKAKKIRKKYGVKHVRLASRNEKAGGDPVSLYKIGWNVGRKAQFIKKEWRKRFYSVILGNVANEAAKEHDLRAAREWRKVGS